MVALTSPEAISGTPDDYRARWLRLEAKWEIIPLDSGQHHCSWVNPETGKVEQVIIPRGFNPHTIHNISFNEMKETCTVEWAGNSPLTLPTSLFRALKAAISSPRKKPIPIEDLKAI